MNQSTMEAYAEIDTILNYMDESYINQIPLKVRNTFKELKSKTYIKDIDPSIPLENQNLKRETITLLSILNYNYWCTDENRKKELMNIYTANTQKVEEELKEKYHPDKIFTNNVQKVDNSSTETISFEDTSSPLTISTEKWYTKIITFFTNIFKKNK